MPPSPSDPLHKQPLRSRSFAIPDVISDRIDALCALVNKDGDLRGTVHRQDLLSALVAFAPEDLATLEKILQDFQGLKVRDALVGDAKNAKVIELRPTKPGRRTV